MQIDRELLPRIPIEDDDEYVRVLNKHIRATGRGHDNGSFLIRISNVVEGANRYKNVIKIENVPNDYHANCKLTVSLNTN